MADRFDRRRIMIWSNLAAAVAATGMLLVDHPAVLRAGVSVPLALAGLAILAALCRRLISPASSAAIPAVVPPEDLADATFLIESTWGTMAAVGSAPGGLVSTLVGREAAIGIDAISFLRGGVSGRGASGLHCGWRRRPATASRRPAGGGKVCPRQPSDRGAAHLESRLRRLRRRGGGAPAGARSGCVREGDDGIGWLLGARGLGVLVGPFLDPAAGGWSRSEGARRHRIRDGALGRFISGDCGCPDPRPCRLGCV